DYMRVALQSVPETQMAEPAGVASAFINPSNGQFANQGLVEYFYEEDVPGSANANAGAEVVEAGVPR
ncbi:MAG: hypothetical protein ACOYMX_08085, partial [Burkholderiales bacterium]